MRLSRWLILAALLAIVAFVGQTYIKRQQALARDTPAAPPPLETGINGRASDWVYTQSDGERPRGQERDRGDETNDERPRAHGRSLVDDVSDR